MAFYGSHSVPAPAQNGKKVISSVSKPSVRPPSYTSDGALLAALREGHREFLRFAIKNTRSINEGEGLVHGFYREMLESVPDIKESEGLKGPITQAYRSALAGYKSRKGASNAAAQERPDVDEPVPMFLDDVERAVSGCLYRILPTLPSDSSWLIWQADLLGQPFDKLAKRLGIGIDHLAMRLARARRIMRGVLQRYGMTCPSHGFLNCTCEQALESAQK